MGVMSEVISLVMNIQSNKYLMDNTLVGIMVT